MKDIIFLLQDYDLKELELENFQCFKIDGRTETTYKLMGTDEGGN